MERFGSVTWAEQRKKTYQKGRHHIRRSYSSQKALLEEQRHTDRLKACFGRKQEQDIKHLNTQPLESVQSADFNELDSSKIKHDKLMTGII